jgi:hypothetical protein
MRSQRTAIVITIATGVALGTMCGVVGLSSLEFSSWIWTVILSSVGIGLLVLLSYWLWQRRELPGWWIPVIFAGGILFRLLCLPATHMMCDDAARYHWDGKLIANGMNPWAAPPHALETIHLRTDALDERINHGNVRTPYPPLAELLFAAGYLLSPTSLIGFQLLSLTAELATWILLLVFLRSRKSYLSPLLLAVWLPLVITEGYLPGHADTLGLPFMAAFLICVLNKRPKLAGLVFAAAFTIKPLVLVLAPAAMRELGPRKSVAASGVATIVIAGLYMPSALTGKSHFGPMMQMARDWDCNGTISVLLEQLMPLATARLVASLLLLASVLAATWWGKDFIARAGLALTAVFIFSPVVFPWYLVWLAPIVALRPDPALLALLVLAPLTTVVQIDLFYDDIWQQPTWSILAAFIPFYALLILGGCKGWGMFRKN